MTAQTDDAFLQPAVAAEFTRLADLLDAASDAQWDTPSLCAGWRVREVIAHLTMAARYSEAEFMAELQRCGFDFTRLSNEIAARDATPARGRAHKESPFRGDAALGPARRRLSRRPQPRGDSRPRRDGAAGRPPAPPGSDHPRSFSMT